MKKKKSLQIFTLCSRKNKRNKEQWTQREPKRKSQHFTKTQLQKTNMKNIMLALKIMNLNNSLMTKLSKEIEASVLARMPNAKMFKWSILLNFWFLTSNFDAF
jgi:hypothetical protein